MIRAMAAMSEFGEALLRKSERIFKTDMEYVVRNGFWLTLGQIIAALSSFILSIAFANLLPRETYGDYKFILTTVSILSSLSLSGLGNVVVQATAMGKEGILEKSVLTSLRWSVFVFTTAILTSVYYFLNGNVELGYAFAIASILVPTINSYGLYGSFLNGRKNFKASTVYWCVSQLINVGALIGAAFFTHNALTLAAVYYISHTASTLFFYFYVVGKYRPNNEHDSSMIGYGKHISLMNFFGTLANQLDKVMVYHYVGAVNLAVYSFAQAIPEQVKGSFKSLFSIALPRYADLDPAHVKKSVWKKFFQLTALSTLAAVAYIVAAPYIFAIFFPRYMDSVFYSQIYMIGLISVPGISLITTYFQVKKATRVMYQMTIIANAVTICLAIVLISKYGVLGGVIENSISWFFILAINLTYFALDKN